MLEYFATKYCIPSRVKQSNSADRKISKINIHLINDFCNQGLNVISFCKDREMKVSWERTLTSGTQRFSELIKNAAKTHERILAFSVSHFPFFSTSHNRALLNCSRDALFRKKDGATAKRRQEIFTLNYSVEVIGFILKLV